MTKAMCPVCHVEGSVQQRGNSVRVGHYKGYHGNTRIVEWHCTTMKDLGITSDIHKILEENKESTETQDFTWFSQLDRERQREILLHIIGKSCILCNSKEKLLFHEIHGQKHPDDLTYILKHHENFVTLCKRCHLGFHLTTDSNTEKFVQLKNKLLSDGKQTVNKMENSKSLNSCFVPRKERRSGLVWNGARLIIWRTRTGQTPKVQKSRARNQKARIPPPAPFISSFCFFYSLNSTGFASHCWFGA